MGEQHLSAVPAILFSLVCLLIVLAVVGNLSVCIAVYKYFRLRKLSNNYIVSLAVSDLLVAALVMFPAAVQDILGKWIFGDLCAVWISLDIMCSTASVLNLCVIAIDRYRYIMNPFDYADSVTLTVVLVQIAAVWLISGAVSAATVYFGLNFAVLETTCWLDLNFASAFLSTCASFYIPGTILICLYGRLYLVSLEHWKQIRRSSLSTAAHRAKQNHKASVTLGIVVGSFVVCWLPFSIVNPLAAYDKRLVPGFIFQIATWLGYFNSCQNPIIYTIFDSNFRRSFKAMFCCVEHSINTISTPSFMSRRMSTAVGPASCVPSARHGEEADAEPQHKTDRISTLEPREACLR